MNKLSGYKSISLADGSTIELKFGMGALELFGKSIGVKTLDEALRQLNAEQDEQGNILVTFEYLAIIRKLLFAAAQFAALSQGKPVDFNEYTAGDWIDEIGIEGVLYALDLFSEVPAEVPEGAKKRRKNP